MGSVSDDCWEDNDPFADSDQSTDDGDKYSGSKHDSTITESHLTTFFAARPKNFQLERQLGSGAAANAWLVRYRKQAGDPWGRIVLKTPVSIAESGYVPNPLDVQLNILAFENEIRLLNTIRTRHLVKLIKFSDGEDPLKRPGASSFIGRWVYLEYLQHGTLSAFTRKCATHMVPHLPNRLLWRIFMCLIRACVAMAYVPAVPVDRYDENEEPCDVDRDSVSYSHNDMHSDNIMIGDMLSDPDDVEHSICPVVKFIDIDVHSQYADTNDAPHPLSSEGGEGDGVERNLLSVAANMTELVLLDSTLGYDVTDAAETDDSVWFEPGGFRDGFATAVKQLLPPSDGSGGAAMPAPWLDPDLRRLLCECAAVRGRDRPVLAEELLPAVLEAVEQRDAAYYRRAGYCDDAGAEEDAAILGLLQRVLGAAPPPPPTPAVVPGGEEEAGGEGPESTETVDRPARRFLRTDRDRRSASPENRGKRYQPFRYRTR
ncbi:hypothetical protein PG994_001064 [Apiospora phragmitis]|uniref:Protein kinase domain-containing protein n=1 Tax=Apiospora phragmitis TaxID=2905665 RepID=A0ABR1WSG4_9PEZI